jgi:hypothetical protein
MSVNSSTSLVSSAMLAQIANHNYLPTSPAPSGVVRASVTVTGEFGLISPDGAVTVWRTF